MSMYGSDRLISNSKWKSLLEKISSNDPSQEKSLDLHCK